jgi:hypothetical protein
MHEKDNQPDELPVCDTTHHSDAEEASRREWVEQRRREKILLNRACLWSIGGCFLLIGFVLLAGAILFNQCNQALSGL